MQARLAIHDLRVIAVCAILLLAGCGRSLESTVQGTVTFDGKPLLMGTGAGTVTFHPVNGGAVAHGTIQSNGAYRLQTGKAGGLAPGEYRITVKAAETQTPEQAAALQMPKLITPPRYSDTATTDLRGTVKSGSNEINLALQP